MQYDMSKLRSKVSYPQFEALMLHFNSMEHEKDEKLNGVIVFKNESFEKDYSVEERSYIVSSDNKAFNPNACGYSLYGSSLDGSDIGVRLEQYMAYKTGVKGWEVEYCYFL